MRRDPSQICAMCREWKFTAASAEQQAAGIGLCDKYGKPMLFSESSVLFAPTQNEQARRNWLENFTKAKDGN